MKFPARKKRTRMSAHMAATSPYGPRASAAARQHTNADDGEASDGFIQKYSLRRRHKSEDLRRDNECDAELVETSSTNPSSETIWFGSRASLPQPALILTPSSPETGKPLPTRRRTVHGNGGNDGNTQKKTGNPPRSNTMATLTSFAALKSTKLAQKLSWVKSAFRSRRSDETLRPSKQTSDQENEGDDAGTDAQPEPRREASGFLVPPRLDLDLGPEW